MQDLIKCSNRTLNGLIVEAYLLPYTIKDIKKTTGASIRKSRG